MWEVELTTTVFLKAPYRQLPGQPHNAEWIVSNPVVGTEEAIDRRCNLLAGAIAVPDRTIYVNSSDDSYTIPTNNIAYIKHERKWLRELPEAEQPSTEAEAESAEGTEDGGAAGPGDGADGGPPAGQNRRY